MNQGQIWGYKPSGRGGSTVSGGEEQIRGGWNGIIDFRLIEWGSNSTAFDNEIEAPSTLSVQTAIKMAQSYRDRSIPTPDWVVPSGDGGIYFRWGEIGVELFTVEFAPNGIASIILTRDSEVVLRQQVESETVQA